MEIYFIYLKNYFYNILINFILKFQFYHLEPINFNLLKKIIIYLFTYFLFYFIFKPNRFDNNFIDFLKFLKNSFNYQVINPLKKIC